MGCGSGKAKYANANEETKPAESNGNGVARGGYRGSCAAYEMPFPVDAEAPNGSAENAKMLTPADADEQAKINAAKNRPRRAGVSAETVTVDKDWKPPFFEKPDEAVAFLRMIITSSKEMQVMTGHLDESSVTTLIGAMFKKTIADGERLIQQGDPGDNFYIVEQGCFDIFVKRNDGTEGKVMEAGRGMVFGQLALMYNAPRAATCIAAGECQVWALEREAFKQLLISAESSDSKISPYDEFLQSIEFFDILNAYERAQLCDVFVPDSFDAKRTIVKQGEPGSHFFLLEKGSAIAYMDGAEGTRRVATYVTGDFFGEMALLEPDGLRRAAVYAGPDGCEVLTVEKADFERCLKPLAARTRTQIETYQKYDSFISSAVSEPELASPLPSPGAGANPLSAEST